MEKKLGFQPVYISGPSKGKVKKNGITASGTKARKGAIAADTRKYPFGTIMYVEGYGYGRVEDRDGIMRDVRWGFDRMPCKCNDEDCL